ncbi:MAG: glycosyltransferase family 4 protein, partial [Bacillota bacterium]
LAVSSHSFEKYFHQKLRIHKPIYYLPIYAEDFFYRYQESHAGDRTHDISKTNLVFAGNVGEMQSMDTIIRAADLLKGNDNVHFHIVGDGSALNKSKALVKSLSLTNIKFHGRHPLEDMPKFYELADAFLVTLRKDPFISYTLPGKVQSYMAAGKPILAAIDGEAYETIQAAGCGLCCPAEDYEGFAAIISEFAENKSNYHNYGNCANAYYQANFSEKSFFDSLLSLLEQ